MHYYIVLFFIFSKSMCLYCALLSEIKQHCFLKWKRKLILWLLRAENLRATAFPSILRQASVVVLLFHCRAEHECSHLSSCWSVDQPLLVSAPSPRPTAASQPSLPLEFKVRVPLFPSYTLGCRFA